MEKIIRNIKVGQSFKGIKVGKIIKVYEEGFSQEVLTRIEIMRPYLRILNNYVFSIQLTSKPDPTLPIDCIGNQLQNTEPEEGVDPDFDYE